MRKSKWIKLQYIHLVIDFEKKSNNENNWTEVKVWSIVW